jgi:cytidine deaminase
MIPEDIDRLITAAEDAMKNSIAPYSDFRVGASIITEGGRIYSGCNIENPSLMLSFCAERAALIKMAAHRDGWQSNKEGKATYSEAFDNC